MSDIPEPTPDCLPPPALETPAPAGERTPDAVPDGVPEAVAAPAAAPAAEPAPAPDLSPAAVAARLGELFPALFAAGEPKPIKLRIQADIQQRAPGQFTKKALSVFLHRHTTSTPYLRALVASATRFDLDGAPAGEMLDEHRDAATVELARRRDVVAARRAAERDAQRAAQAARRPPAPSAPSTPVSGAPVPGAADRPARPPRRREDGPRPPRRAPERSQERGRPPARPTVRHPERPDGPPQEALPEDEGQRQRAVLLRAWEASPLTKANFCVLKGLAEADFDAQLARALDERKQRGAPPRELRR